jgi:cytochrome P450
VLTRYADVTAVLRSAPVSSDRANKAPQQAAGPEYQALNEVRAFSMLDADPPRHTRLRLLVNKAFTPRTVEELAPFIRAFVDKALDAAAWRGRMELMGGRGPQARVIGVRVGEHPRPRRSRRPAPV